MRFTPALAALAFALSACATAPPAPQAAAIAETPAPETRAPRLSEQEQLAAYWAARANPPPYIRVGAEFARPPAPEGELFLSDDQLDRDAERLERQSRAFQEAVRRSMEEPED